MKYKFNGMTTEVLIDIKEQIKSLRETKKDEIAYIRQEMLDLRNQLLRIDKILAQRKKSPYNGEYYVKSKFRLKYGVPFRELSREEQLAYHRERYEKYYKYARKLKRKQAKTKT